MLRQLSISSRVFSHVRQACRPVSTSMYTTPLVIRGKPLVPRKVSRRFFGGPHQSAGRRDLKNNGEPDRKGPRELRDPEGAESHETLLNATEMKELFEGKFPADYDKKGVHLKTSYATYRTLSQAFKDSKEQYPRKTVTVEWNARISTTSILRTPCSPLHASVVNSVVRSFVLQIPRDEHFMLAAEETLQVPEVGNKAPNFMLRFDVPAEHSCGAHDTMPILFAEVGFSEKKGDLEASMRMWFDSFPTINMGFLVKIDEHPGYRKPFRSHSRAKGSEFLQNPEASYNKKIISQNPEATGSPLYLSDFRLVGKTKAYMEIWTRDPKTGKPMKKGDRIEFYGYGKPVENFAMKFNQFVPSNDPIYEKEFVFYWATFEHTIDKHRSLLAIERRNDIISEHKKKQSGQIDEVNSSETGDN